MKRVIFGVLFSLLTSFSHARGITQDQFKNILYKLDQIYVPIVAREGGHLNLQSMWMSSLWNMTNDVDNRGRWIIKVHGGIPRFEGITSDAVALAICHELGHRLGGEPFGSEGQADYFATHKCMRLYLEDEDHSEALRGQFIPTILNDACNKTYLKLSDQQICIRSGLAAIVLSGVIAQIRRESMPKFETPDTFKTRETIHGHPNTQCRLDTFLKGALSAPKPKCWFKSNL